VVSFRARNGGLRYPALLRQLAHLSPRTLDRQKKATRASGWPKSREDNAPSRRPSRRKARASIRVSANCLKSRQYAPLLSRVRHVEVLGACRRPKCRCGITVRCREATKTAPGLRFRAGLGAVSSLRLGPRSKQRSRDTLGTDEELLSRILRTHKARIMELGRACGAGQAGMAAVRSA
jgi:hypothetical protein